MREKLFDVLYKIYTNPSNTSTSGEGIFASSIKEISVDVIDGANYYSITNYPSINDAKNILVKNQLTDKSIYITLRTLKSVSFKKNELVVGFEDGVVLKLKMSFNTAL